MTKIIRDLSTEENRAFWARAEAAAKEVSQWPDWKRAGINVEQIRSEPREIPADESAVSMARPNPEGEAT